MRDQAIARREARSLTEQRDTALRELAAAHRAYRRGYAALVHTDEIPLKEFHRLQDAKLVIVEIAAKLYPEGT
jgi:hypothetical protein